MIVSRLFKVLGVINLIFFTGFAYSAEMLMARTGQSFPEAMLKLQEELKKSGYTISRVQRVDIGLTKSGYQTDKYRIVFFGKSDEVKLLSDRHPELIPHLPWKIAIFAEDEDTLLVSVDPTLFTDKQHPESYKILRRWSDDIQSIFDVLRQEDE